MARRRATDPVIARVGGLSVERDPTRPTGRLLRQDDMDASYIDLADARHLEFDYLRWARIVLDAAGARRVLHVGGAGCALARALAAADPETRHEVVEIDPEVLAVARQHLGLRCGPGLKIPASATAASGSPPAPTTAPTRSCSMPSSAPASRCTWSRWRRSRTPRAWRR